MKLIKLLKSEKHGCRKYTMGLFECPVCLSLVKKMKIKGVSLKQCSRKCYKTSRTGLRRGAYKKRIEISKYMYVMLPDHPRANKKGYVSEAVVVMENHIGRYLFDDETVHHKNFNSLDNDINNLQLMKTHDHLSFHAKERRKRNGGKV